LAEVFIRARARRDILSNAEYLDEHGGEETAQRFLDATQSTFEALAKMPRLGALCSFRRPALRRLRRWPVKGFENWLSIYRDAMESRSSASFTEPVTLKVCSTASLAANCPSGCATGSSALPPWSPKARDQGHPQQDRIPPEIGATRHRCYNATVFEKFFKRLEKSKALREELRLEIRAYRGFMPS